MNEKDEKDVMNEKVEKIEPVMIDGEVETIDPLTELVEHDFLSDSEINLDESYELIKMLDREKSANEKLEADHILEDIAHIYVEREFKEKLDKTIENFKNFKKKYDVGSDLVKTMNESEKTKTFAIASFLNKNIANMINVLKFDVTLTRGEYTFIAQTLERKMSYDGNEVFNIIELNNKYLSEWKKIDKNLPKEIESFVVNIDIKNIVMLYHFISKYKVKGIDKEYYKFISVLEKIADTNKLFNAYNIIKERMNEEFTIWVSALETATVETPTVEEKCDSDCEQECARDKNCGE